ncbi:MAG: EpsG family protein [Bacteroidales bacterium]|uniref:EpsG family protein n=1 Tax=Porphyromonas sp. TaxID=1924944 RepID=UPI0029711B84|nr:EpsG family protein [Porphyromonas sp.]MDD7438336.1 EpsG family protein [Bacteroidales bacterium]MDY3066761.1 EpsG family protein [Porphyromonas sp.]
MVIYITILLLLFILGNTQNKYSESFFRLACFSLAVILGFRDNNVGADTLRYAEYYSYASYNIGHMEPGWNMLIFLCKSIGLSSYGFNFFIAIITIICIAIPLEKVFVKSNTRSLALFCLVALGFYFLMFNGMRQTTGIAICFYAFYISSQKKILWPTLLVLLASTLHTSCLLALPAVFVSRLPRLSLSTILIAFTSSMIIGLIATQNFYVTISGSYAYDVLGEGSFNSHPILYFSTIVFLSNAFFLFLFLKTPKVLHDNYWFKLYFVALIIQGILFRLTYGQRIVYFYSFSAVVLFPILITEFKRKKEIGLACYLYALVFFLRFLLQETPGAPGSLIPYTMTFKPFI